MKRSSVRQSLTIFEPRPYAPASPSLVTQPTTSKKSTHRMLDQAPSGPLKKRFEKLCNAEHVLEAIKATKFEVIFLSYSPPASSPFPSFLMEILANLVTKYS